MVPLPSLAEVSISVGALLLSGVLLAGCASSRSPSAATSATRQSQGPAAVDTRLRAAADRWEGVPHKWGGSSRRGVDCSGLVQSVFENEFRLSLPRTTEEQVRLGRRVRRPTLQAGDLVFFRHGRKKYHVGIYLSSGEFLHASSSSGVTVSPIDRSYWSERWWQARRILTVRGDSTRVASDSTRDTAGSTVGW